MNRSKAFCETKTSWIWKCGISQESLTWSDFHFRFSCFLVSFGLKKERERERKKTARARHFKYLFYDGYQTINRALNSVGIHFMNFTDKTAVCRTIVEFFFECWRCRLWLFFEHKNKSLPNLSLPIRIHVILAPFLNKSTFL